MDSLLHDERKRRAPDPVRPFRKVSLPRRMISEEDPDGAKISCLPLKRTNHRHRAEQPTPEPRYEPLRGSPAIGQAASAVGGTTSPFTVALQVDGAGGYPFALIFGRGLPVLAGGELHLDLPQEVVVCPKANFSAKWLPPKLKQFRPPGSKTRLAFSRRWPHPSA